jgi:hypothetical protein
MLRTALEVVVGLWIISVLIVAVWVASEVHRSGLGQEPRPSALDEEPSEAEAAATAHAREA